MPFICLSNRRKYWLPIMWQLGRLDGLRDSTRDGYQMN